MARQPIIPTCPSPSARRRPRPNRFRSGCIPEPTISGPLAALSENWPEALRLEIRQLNLANAQVALPANLVEPALKRGRVMFAWRNLRSLIKPTPPAVSVHDGLELELPLKVVAPLFFARQKAAPAGHSRSKRLAGGNSEFVFWFSATATASRNFRNPNPAETAPARMPDHSRFAGSRNRPAVRPPAARTRILTVDGHKYYIWTTPPRSPRATRPNIKRPQRPATDFTSRHATPNEIVARAMELPGVAGALVALPDGLMVASQIPSELNADTLAAFLPQIYGRVSQCTRELRMGELNNLNFTVGNVPWKIFRVNGVYFAAFGRAGEALPTAQLAALAAELDRKKQ